MNLLLVSTGNCFGLTEQNLVTVSVVLSDPSWCIQVLNLSCYLTPTSLSPSLTTVQTISSFLWTSRNGELSIGQHAVLMYYMYLVLLFCKTLNIGRVLNIAFTLMSVTIWTWFHCFKWLLLLACSWFIEWLISILCPLGGGSTPWLPFRPRGARTQHLGFFAHHGCVLPWEANSYPADRNETVYLTLLQVLPLRWMCSGSSKKVDIHAVPL